MTNIEKIKDMMSNELWMAAIDSVTELIVTAADLQKEVDALKEQNESLIKEHDAQKEKIKELESLVNLYRQKAIAANGLYKHEHIKNNELKAKELVGMIATNPCHDSDDAYLPDSNTIIKVKNQYLINNYFSEEDKSNG